MEKALDQAAIEALAAELDKTVAVAREPALAAEGRGNFIVHLKSINAHV
jgi:hypothetical protein